MKLISSLALVAALFVSSSTARLDLCGAKNNVNIYDSKFEGNCVNPMNEMCIEIEGEFKSAFNSGSTVEFTASFGGVSRTWTSDAFTSMRDVSVPLEKGEHGFKACSYLAPEFKDTEAGKQISIKVEFYNKDSQGDLVPFFCVKGAAPVKR